VKSVSPDPSIRDLSLQEGVVYATIMGLKNVKQAHIVNLLSETLKIDPARIRQVIRNLENKGFVSSYRSESRGKPKFLTALLDPVKEYLKEHLPNEVLSLALDLILLDKDEQAEEGLPPLRVAYINLLKRMNIRFENIRISGVFAILMYLVFVHHVVESAIFKTRGVDYHKIWNAYLPQLAKEKLFKIFNEVAEEVLKNEKLKQKIIDEFGNKGDLIKLFRVYLTILLISFIFT